MIINNKEINRINNKEVMNLIIEVEEGVEDVVEEVKIEDVENNMISIKNNMIKNLENNKLFENYIYFILNYLSE